MSEEKKISMEGRLSYNPITLKPCQNCKEKDARIDELENILIPYVANQMTQELYARIAALELALKDATNIMNYHKISYSMYIGNMLRDSKLGELFQALLYEYLAHAGLTGCPVNDRIEALRKECGL